MKRNDVTFQLTVSKIHSQKTKPEFREEAEKRIKESNLFSFSSLSGNYHLIDFFFFGKEPSLRGDRANTFIF